jgi:hypothetical protein
MVYKGGYKVLCLVPYEGLIVTTVFFALIRPTNTTYDLFSSNKYYGVQRSKRNI